MSQPRTRKRSFKTVNIDEEIYTYKKARLERFYEILINHYDFKWHMEYVAPNDENTYTIPRYIHFMIKKLIEPTIKVNELVKEHLDKRNNDNNDDDDNDLIDDVDDFDLKFDGFARNDTYIYKHSEIAELYIDDLNLTNMVHFIIFFYNKIVLYHDASKKTELSELHLKYNENEIIKLQNRFKEYNESYSDALRRKNHAKEILDIRNAERRTSLLKNINDENEKLKIAILSTEEQIIRQNSIFTKYIEEFNRLYYYYNKIMKTDIELPGDNNLQDDI
jgi:hypothetical protein